VVAAERPDLHLARGYRALRVYNDGYRRVIDHLLIALCVHIDTGEPATVARVRVIPPRQLLRLHYFRARVLIRDLELLRAFSRVYSRLRCLAWQSVNVHDPHCVSLRIAEQVTHDFDVSACLGMHRRLDKRNRGEHDLLEVVGICFPKPGPLDCSHLRVQELENRLFIVLIDLHVLRIVFKQESLQSSL